MAKPKVEFIKVKKTSWDGAFMIVTDSKGRKTAWAVDGAK